MRRRVRTMRAQGCAVRVDGSAARGRQCAARRRSGTGRLVGSNRRAGRGVLEVVMQFPGHLVSVSKRRGAPGVPLVKDENAPAAAGAYTYRTRAVATFVRLARPFFASSKVAKICERLSLSLSLSLIVSPSGTMPPYLILSYVGHLGATYRITPLERRGRRPWTYSYRSRSPGMIGAVAGVRAHRKRHGSTITKGPTNKPVIIDGVQVLTDADRDHHQGKRSPRN
jgi:hypothetical protein